MRAIFSDRKVLSWALYDWANSAFSTTVLAAFFPAFYKDYWSAGVAASTSTFQLGLGHALASALKQHGGEIRTEAGVEQIIVRDGKVQVERRGNVEDLGQLAGDDYFNRLARQNR